MRTALKILVVCTALFSAGCAALFQDDLDRAYQSGKLSTAEYYKLKERRHEASQRQAMYYQQQQNAAAAQYMQTIHTAPATPMFSTPFLQDAPQKGSIDGGGAQSKAEPRLPSGLTLEQMRKGQGVTTGRTRLASDGVLWREYKTWDGTTYWARTQ